MLHQASVTNLVDRLEDQGFVAREPHPTDRRTTLAALTPEGRAIIDDATKAVIDARVGVTELSDRDARELNRILRKLRAGAADFT
jgi:DNA-binding MarR family transcriptional regulator